MTEKTLSAWKQREQDTLNLAIESSHSIRAIIQKTQTKIQRSEKAILRRLKKIGYQPQAVGKYIAASNLGV